jgi:hypothetical protein
MILPAALLCNYGRGFCLINVGTEGNWKAPWIFWRLQLKAARSALQI